MVLLLRYYGDPILRERARPVTDFDDVLHEEAEAMVDTMFRERGIGLAGPQVGLSKRIIVATRMRDRDDDDGEPVVLVNPKVVDRSTESWQFEEGCLSLPGINADVTRAERVTVSYFDLDGAEVVEEADGLYARILLHEIDHLDGRLFIDYLSAARKTLLKPKLREIAERYSSGSP